MKKEPEQLSKQERIDKSIKTMRSIFKKQNMTLDKLKAANEIIKRTAFMQITLEDLETDINELGATELFSQTEGIVYSRERPSSAVYNRMIKNYTAVCKQLFDMIPQEEKSKASGMSEDENDLLEMMKSGRR